MVWTHFRRHRLERLRAVLQEPDRAPLDRKPAQPTSAQPSDTAAIAGRGQPVSRRRAMPAAAARCPGATASRGEGGFKSSEPLVAATATSG